MKALQILLSERFIIKSKNLQTYLLVKDGLKMCKKFVEEKLGYTIIVTPTFIKLEKVPGMPEPWMGILAFSSIKEYEMLCYLLMFLEDKEVESQFVLSEITEYLQLQFDAGTLEWTNFATRKQLVRVVKYATDTGLITLNDGDEAEFSKDKDAEVLYENTGISKYFLRYFGTDIMDLLSPNDFMSTAWHDIDEDRGLMRRQRVYRRLLLSPGVYRDDQLNEDFAYIRNRRHQIEKDFQEVFDCDLHVHSSSAYLSLDELKRVGKVFPGTGTIDEMIVCLFGYISFEIKSSEVNHLEQVRFERDVFDEMLFNGIEAIKPYISKTYRVKETPTLVEEIKRAMIRYGFIVLDKDTALVYPIVGKLKGYYNVKELT